MDFRARRLTVAGLTLTLLTLALAAAAQPAYQTKHVFIVVMDGVRYMDTFGDPTHQLIPRLFNDLRPQGTLFTNYYDRGITVTRQGHSTMISGTWQPVLNGGARLTMPTFMDYYRDQRGAAETRCWSIFGKARYSFEPYSSEPAYGNRFTGKHFNGGPDTPANEQSAAGDVGVLAKVLEVMKSDQPDVMFINFGYTDHSGHIAKDIAEYQAAIKNCDEQFGKLWDAIQADPYYRDTTTVFFTNDHGRHTTDFHSHGDHCEGCEHIMLLVLGPDTPKGTTVETEALQIDLAPTAGELLGIQTPLSTGRVLTECLTQNLGLNKKEATTETARKAVAVEQLAARDLMKIAADQALATSKPEAVAANLDGELLAFGMIRAQAQMKDQRYLAFVQQWLEAHQAATDPDQQAAVGSVILELPQAARQERLALAQRIGEALAALPTEGAKRPSLLAAGAFLGRLGQVTKETKYSDAGLKLVAAALAQPAPQPAGSREAAGGLCLLGMAVAAYPQDAATMKAYLIGVFGALRAMKETGGLWDDPAASALNLAALEAGRRVAAFKEFTEMKGADAKPPAVVAAIPEPELRALFPMQPKAPLPRLQRQFTTMIVDRAKKNAPISQDLLKYGVDEQGAYADGSPAAQGGFLLAYKKLDWRYGGNTWPGPKQARRAK